MAEKILVTDDNVRSGWSSKHQRNLYSSERIYEALTAQGVPGQAIVTLPFGKSGTVFDAIAVRDYLAKMGGGEIMLLPRIIILAALSGFSSVSCGICR